MTNIVKYTGYNRGWRLREMNIFYKDKLIMDKLIEEYREELKEKQNAELRARLARNRTTEELFSALLALAPEKEPVYSLS